MLARTASDCVSKGEVCLTHCYELLAQGDKSMASCAKTVREMLAICTALRSLASQEAPALPKVAGVALEACNRCEAECRKHEKTHSQCKECGDACAACAAECKKVASA
jgi:Cys-rich four helix bundle protein (predicted Tat secretion target)